MPFSVSGGLQLRANGAPAWKQVTPWFGVTPVPQRLTMTPAQELAAEIMAASRPGEPMTEHQFDAGAMIKDVVRQMKAGNGAAGAVELAGGIQTGELNPDAAHVMIERMKYTPLQFQVHNMTAEAAMRVWAVANTSEREQLGNIIRLKVANSRTIPPAVKVGMIEALGGRKGEEPNAPTGQH